MELCDNTPRVHLVEFRKVTLGRFREGNAGILYMLSKAQNKTQPTKQSAAVYVRSIEDAATRKEAKELVKLFAEATAWKPVMWGNMVGFGSYHYKYDSGREGDFFATGFALRKSGPTVYIMPGYEEYADMLKKLGPHKLGKSCLYLKSLADVDEAVLKRLIKAGLRDLKKQYPVTAS